MRNIRQECSHILTNIDPLTSEVGLFVSLKHQNHHDPSKYRPVKTCQPYKFEMVNIFKITHLSLFGNVVDRQYAKASSLNAIIASLAYFYRELNAKMMNRTYAGG